MVGTTSLCRFRIFMTASVKLNKFRCEKSGNSTKQTDVLFLPTRVWLSHLLHFCLWTPECPGNFAYTCPQKQPSISSHAKANPSDKKRRERCQTSSEPSARTAFLASCRAAGWSLSWCWPTSRATPAWGRRRRFSHMRFQNLRSNTRFSYGLNIQYMYRNELFSFAV